MSLSVRGLERVIPWSIVNVVVYEGAGAVLDKLHHLTVRCAEFILCWPNHDDMSKKPWARSLRFHNLENKIKIKIINFRRASQRLALAGIVICILRGSDVAMLTKRVVVGRGSRRAGGSMRGSVLGTRQIMGIN